MQIVICLLGVASLAISIILCYKNKSGKPKLLLAQMVSLIVGEFSCGFGAVSIFLEGWDK